MKYIITAAMMAFLFTIAGCDDDNGVQDAADTAATVESTSSAEDEQDANPETEVQTSDAKPEAVEDVEETTDTE